MKHILQKGRCYALGLIFLLSAITSAAESNNTVKAPREVAIAKTVLDSEVIWLPDQKANEQFLALLLESEDEEVAGAVLIIPDQYETLDAVDVISPLRKYFPKVGWNTLSINMPVKGEQVAASETKVEQLDGQTEQAATEDSKTQENALEKVRTANLTRISAALAWLKEKKPKHILLLGHGTGAMWASELLADDSSVKVRGLILISAYPPVKGELAQKMAERLSQLKVPILDLIAGFDHDFVKKAAKVRLKWVHKNQTKRYRQKQLLTADYDFSHQTEQLVKIIRGWLKTKKKKKRKRRGIETNLIVT